MVEIAEIVDQESFRAWLEQEDLPREAMVALAHRAAMRVLPVWWREVDHAYWTTEPNVTSLVVFRCLVISGASVLGFAPRIAANVTIAVAAGYDAAAAVYAADAAAYPAAAAAAAAAAADADAAAAVYIDDYDYPNADEAAYTALRADCARVSDLSALMATPLWHDAPNPLQSDWDDVRAHYRDLTDHPYGFWLDWYQRALNGTETRWSLLRQVALLDTDDDGEDLWENPEKLAAEIARLETEYRLRVAATRHPYAWDMAVGRGATLVSIPIETTDVAHIVTDTRRALDEHRMRCRGRAGRSDIGPAIGAAFADTIKDLRKRLSKYKSNPAELFRAIEEARHEMILIARNEGFENEPMSARLIGNLTIRAQDICVAAPSVFEMVKDRQKVSLALMSTEMVSVARHLCAGLAKDASGELQAAALLALAIISDPDRSEEERLGAWQFVQSAVPRAAIAAIEFEEAQAGEGSGRTMLEHADTWAKRIKAADQVSDIAQEAFNDNANWIAELMEKIGWF